MNYAIVENGLVVNTICLNISNADDFPNAILLGDIPAAIGDTYADGKFYRNGEELLTPLKAAEKQLADMKAALELLGVTDNG